MGLRTYTLLTRCLYHLAVPCERLRLLCHLRDPLFSQRFFWHNPFGDKRFDCWFHAVSVGEVGVARVLIEQLLDIQPGLNILVSSSTPQGVANLVGTLGDRCETMVFPLDFPQVVHRVVQGIHVKLYASIETELWPNLILGLCKRGTKCMILNGRLSKRSFRSYMRFKGLFSPVVESFHKICVINEQYGRRFRELGAEEESVVVTGNAKFEGLLSRPDSVRLGDFKDKLSLAKDEQVFCAGSIRGGEEKTIIEGVLEAKKACPRLLTLLVPRHLDRVDTIKQVLKGLGCRFHLWSELELGKERVADWVVVDVIGPLYHLYGLADCAFVGGSIVEKGGQNLMEPASWGIPVVFGPYTENFEEAATALKSGGGGIMVKDKNEFTVALKKLLTNPNLRHHMGNNARQALVHIAEGAATRQVQTILNILEQD